MDAFLGEIRLFPFDYAPENWAFCDGRSLNKLLYQKLYAVIGTTYGSDNDMEFKLPNLQGRVAMGAGHGVGLSDRSVGEPAGGDMVVLTAAHFVAHTHTVNVRDGSDTDAALDEPNAAAYLAQPRTIRLYATMPSTPQGFLSASTIGATTEGNTSRSTLQPYLTLNYCICLSGEEPVRPF